MRLPEDPAGRASLRDAMTAAFPWLLAHDPPVGPQTVDAGECDRCHAEARVVAVCGPGAFGGLGRRCALALGVSAWCEGHRDEATHALARLRTLPAELDTIARLWWVATGEVRPTSAPTASLVAALEMDASSAGGQLEAVTRRLSDPPP